MIRQLLKSKIHGATVTESNINYMGSIIIDEKLMAEADLVEWEKVLIANLTNGSRLETYVIPGKWGSGAICTNGGAALHAKTGDKILIMSFCGLNEKEVKGHRPRVIVVDHQNRPLALTTV